MKKKTDDINARILTLGEKYGFDASNPQELELNLVALKIKQQEAKMKKLGKRPYTEAEVKKKYGFK